MFTVSPEIYNVVSLAARWLFVFFALMLLLFALAWHHSDRKERRDRFKKLPGAGTVGELIVLSGSDQLPPDTWFPVPREGILGALRSCDLVVPCPGVHAQHLDFSWQDGTGLLIRPRAGCDALVDGVPVSRRGAYAGAPLVHGSVLQVGSAVLRLQLFAALAHTSLPFAPQAPQPAQPPLSGPDPQQMPYAPGNNAPEPPVFGGQPPLSVPNPQQMPYAQQIPYVPEAFSPESAYPAPSEDRQQSAAEEKPAPPPRRKRSERWKEDWSE